MSLKSNGIADSVHEDGYRMARDYVSSNRWGLCDVSVRSVMRLATMEASDTGFLSPCRLSASHFLWEKILGFNLHPAIPLPADKQDLKIADVGTGTGIWLVDISRQLPPSAQLDGFDVSTDQFPYQGWLPSNISLQKLDIVDDQVPKHLQGRYDIIQVRLFVMVVKNDPTPILRNLHSMLKPGGYLQWADVDHRKMYVDAAKSGLKQAGGEAYIKQLNALQNFDWTSQLPTHFANTGFALVTHASYPVPSPLKNYFLDLIISAADEVTRCGMEASKGMAMRKALREAWEESKQGAVVVMVPEIWVGRKDMDEWL